MAEPMQNQAQHPVELTALTGLTLHVSEETSGKEIALIKPSNTTGQKLWDAFAVSVQSIQAAHNSSSGVAFVMQDQLTFAVGLTNQQSCFATNSAHSTIDFCMLLSSNGTVQVYEDNQMKRSLGGYKRDSVVQISLNDQHQIEYSIDGTVHYVSCKAPFYPLSVKVCAIDSGRLLKQLQWVPMRQCRCCSQKIAAIMQDQHHMIVAHATLQRQTRQLQVQVAQLEAEQAAALNGKAMLEVTNGQLESEVQVLRQEKDNLEVTIGKLESEVQVLRQEKKGLEVTTGQLESEVQVLRHEKEGLEVTTGQLESEVQVLRQENEGLEVTTGQLQSQMQELHQQKEVLFSENASLLAVQQRLQQDLQESESGLSKLAHEKELSESYSERLSQDNRALSTECQSLQQQLEASKSASVCSQANSLSSNFAYIQYNEAEMRYVKLQCLGCSREDLDIKHKKGRNHTWFVSVQRQASHGLPAAHWSHEFQFDDDLFELQQDKIDFDKGLLLLPFRRKAEEVTTITIPTQCFQTSRASCEHSEPSEWENVSSVHGTASDFSSTSRKCFLPNTSFQTPDGHLLLVQNITIGCKVKLSNQQEATVKFVKKHNARKKKPSKLVELVTCQDTFRVSEGHLVVNATSGKQPILAEQLKEGDFVSVGSKARQLMQVRHFEEVTDLWEVGFVADAPLDMFPVSNRGLQTLEATHVGTDSQFEPHGLSPTHWGMQAWGSTSAGADLLELVGIPIVSESELIDAMPDTNE